jgi:hypothetical protein
MTYRVVMRSIRGGIESYLAEDDEWTYRLTNAVCYATRAEAGEAGRKQN